MHGRRSDLLDCRPTRPIRGAQLPDERGGGHPLRPGVPRVVRVPPATPRDDLGDGIYEKTSWCRSSTRSDGGHGGRHADGDFYGTGSDAEYVRHSNTENLISSYHAGGG